ncbi:SpoIIIAH-like family protein [Alicyclobacillus dauci]|uniref:SpoIIIAH-like family protein n=1 Tax=Alicyclobacillus dauci TaxID=1475485 RepID=A0ABY6Z844_9BACL|nr:SpoIIIAH-like family protein [Alicyclobacillus dauci]WAH39002.1 SpoIIIAH-like family protein [Alicyclobacillus dauci]
MVKRQTVWLSTMMVLSLMLIGYYTMNNQTSTTSATPSNPSVSTSSDTPGTGSSAQGSGSGSGSTTGDNSTSTTTGPTGGSVSDWFTSQQTSVDQQMSQQIASLKSVMANNNASSDQVAQAAKQVGQLESLNAGLGNATQAIKADGFTNAVIVPDAKEQNFQVYVQTNNLQKSDAIKIMNIVSQQLDVSMLNVTVKAHNS